MIYSQAPLLAWPILVTALAAAPPPALFLRNENHIFNAIHASLRQWDSSYHHNGMSFFLASVPADTTVYHSEFSNVSISGLKWLGFEPQLPLDCLRGTLVPGGPPPDVRPPGWDDDEGLEHGQTALVLAKRRDPHENEVVGAQATRTPFLHTYRTSRELRLLYIDGQSASKTLNGTLDSTDRILLNDVLGDNPINVDRQRGTALCDLWPAGSLDGFIRMQEGFEIMLCNSEKAVELQSVILTDGYDQLKNMGETLWQSVFADVRPDAVLDYESMVTAYADEYHIELFSLEQPGLPRLSNMTSAQRAAVLKDVDALVLGGRRAGPGSFNWQRVASNIVAHFAGELKRLASTHWTNKGDLDSKLDHFLRPYVDIRHRNQTGDVERCTNMYLPSRRDSSIAASIEAVSKTVCQELFRIRGDEALADALDRTKTLIDALGWSAFKYCEGCRGREFCFVPQWFLGGLGDRDQPRCRNFSDFSQRTDYWGNLGRKRD